MARYPMHSTLTVCMWMVAALLQPIAIGNWPSQAAASESGASECEWENILSAAQGFAEDFAIFDDGNGPRLYMGGGFTNIGEQSADHLAVWNGNGFDAFPGSPEMSAVRALQVFDDGSGPALYVAGTFTTIDGEPFNRIAKWDGKTWAALGSGLDSVVRTLTVFDDGTGPALYAGGYFNMAGGLPADSIAKWNGENWQPLAEGLDSGNCFDLIAFDAPMGPRLIAAGSFGDSGGDTSIAYIAQWDGENWDSIGLPPEALEGEPIVYTLEVFDDGSGPRLYAAGDFYAIDGQLASNIACWDGQLWTPLLTGVHGFVSALEVHDDLSGPALYAGGSITFAGGVSCSGFARWDGASWSAVGDEWIPNSGSSSGSMASFDDGTGPTLFASQASTNGLRYARWKPCNPGEDRLVPSQFTTIQAAINAAEDGDRIYIDVGTYPETIDLLGKRLLIESLHGAQSVVIDASRLDGPAFSASTGDFSGTIIRGITFHGGSSNTGGGVLIQGSSLVLEDCVIRESVATTVGGGVAVQDGSPVFRRCRFESNSAVSGGALSIAGISSPVIERCVFASNSATNGGAVHCVTASVSDASFTHCSFFSNSADRGGAMLIGGLVDLNLDACGFVGNAAEVAGALEIIDGIVTMDSAAVIDNATSGGVGGAVLISGGLFSVAASRFCANDIADLSGNWNDLGENEFLTDCPTGSMVHVPADFATIQAAIDWSLTGFEIIVAPGLYEEAIDLRGRGIWLHSSDGPMSTTIDSSKATGPTILLENGEQFDAVIEGFTLRDVDPGHVHGVVRCIGAQCTIRDCHFIASTTSGIRLQQDSSAVIEHCEFRNNDSSGGGPGVAIRFGSTAIVRDCLFEGNTADDGDADGGAVLVFLNSCLIARDCQFVDNYGRAGGAIAVHDNSVADIADCVFEGNFADSSSAGAIAAQVAELYVTGSEFRENAGVFGGGIAAIYGALIDLRDSIFVDNHSDTNGGGLFVADYYPGNVITVQNCTFADNSTNDIGASIFHADESILFVGESGFCGDQSPQIVGSYEDLGGNILLAECLVGDVDFNGLVNVVDMLMLLASWGSCAICQTDLNGDDVVDVLDLLLLLQNWS